MTKKVNIREAIGLTSQEADECWNQDFMDPGDVEDPESALSDIISNNELSAAQKVYATWIYTNNRKERLKLIEANMESW